MQSHTDTAASHCQLSNTSLEECTREIATNNVVSLLQETVCLIRIRKVGTCADHVGNLLCKSAQNSSRSTTSSGTSLLLNLAPVNHRSFAGKPLFHLLSLLRISLCPLSLSCIALSNNLLQFLSTLSIQGLYLWENLEWVLGISTKILHGVDISVATERSSVGSTVALVTAVVCLASTLTHYTVSDNQTWTLFLSLSLLEGLTNLVNIVTVNLLYIPAPSLILLGSILSGHYLSLCRELNVVGIVEHDEVVETKVTGNTTCTLRNLLLYTTVRDVSIDGLTHYIAKLSLQEFSGNSCTNSEGVALTKRTRGVFNTTGNFTFGVTWSNRTPLTQILQILQSKLTNQGKLAIEHWSHVTWIEEETVATFPLGMLWVINKKFTVESVDKIGTAHSTTWVTRLSLFYH